jgi:hypothetical protein
VSRKRKAVIRFGCSTWQLHNKFGGDEDSFAKKLGLGVTASDVSNNSTTKPDCSANPDSMQFMEAEFQFS